MLTRIVILAFVVASGSIAIVAQHPTPSPTPEDKMVRLGSFIPEPVSGHRMTGKATSLTGETFKFQFDLPKVADGSWFTAPDYDGAGIPYLVPNRDTQELRFTQKFDHGSASSLQDAIEKARRELKEGAPVVEFLGEEDFAVNGISGRIFGSSMAVMSTFPRYTRTYVFFFNGAVLKLEVEAATKDRLEWVTKNGEAVLKSLKVN